MAGAINIKIGVTVTDLVAGFKTAGQASQGFQKQLSGDFKSITGIAQATSVSIGNITSGFKAPKQNIDSLISSLGGLKTSGLGLGALTNTFGGLFAADKVLSFGSAIAETSGKFEKYGAILRNGLGSQSAAKDSLGLLTDFAASTPNSLDELTGSFIKFVNRGLTPTKAQLTNLGDLAASQGKGFDQLTEAVLDAQSGEFERLKEFGVKASKSGDQVTLSFKGVSQTVKNTSENITEAILKFGQLGGVAGSMAAVSLTLEGKLSNLGDTFDRLLVALGEAGVTGAFKEAIDMSSKFLGVITDLIAKSPVEDLQAQKTELNGLVGAIALANDNEAVRLSLVTQLNQKYPEFLGQLNAESVTTDLLTTRLAAANEQYEKKIRIALGQQAIKKSTEELTTSIDQQSNALKQLSTASGKSLTDLEKLSSAERIALAKKLAAQQPQANLGMGVYGANPLSGLATVLEEAGKKQKAAQAELNGLLKENATRQAELTKTTVDGYQQQITQIREKIKLHQIDAKLGEAEIKRLTNLSLTAQGKTVPTVPIKPATVTKPGSGPALLDTGNLAVFKRYAEQLKRQIEEIGENSPQLAEKQQALASINDQIERLGYLTSGTQRVTIPGLAQIVSKDTDTKVKAIVDNVLNLKTATPGLFANSGISSFLTSVQMAGPSLEFVRAKIEEVRNTIANLTFKGVTVPPELIAQLKELKQLLKGSTDATNFTEAMTDVGDNNDDKFLKKAQDRIQKMKDAGQDVTFTAEDLGGQMKAMAKGLATASIGALEAIGTALGSGTNPLKAALQSLTGLLGDYLIKQGEALALAALFSETAALAAGPFAPLIAIPSGFQLAAAAALITGGAAIKAFGVRDFAKGGLFKNEAIIRVGESARALRGGGEAVFPVGMGIDLITDGILQNLSKVTRPQRINTPTMRDMEFRQPVQQVYITGKLTADAGDLAYVLDNHNNSNSTLR